VSVRRKAARDPEIMAIAALLFFGQTLIGGGVAHYRADPGVSLNRGASRGGGAPARLSMSFSMSISIFVARRSAPADLSTSCATTASRLVICRDDDRLVERANEQRRQIFRPRARPARVAALTLLEPSVQRRPAAADFVVPVGLFHTISTMRVAERHHRTIYHVVQ
jgi:hypothetical protein